MATVNVRTFVNRDDEKDAERQNRREKFFEIDRRRRDAGISIEVLCGRALIGARSFNRIQNGACPSRRTLGKLAGALRAIVRETIEVEGE